MTEQHTQWSSFADLYDLEYDAWTERDLPFYLREARARPPLLELACGTGRLAIPIARAGVQVVGLDASREMLEIARAKAGALPQLQLVEGRMESFELHQQFGTIAIAFSSFFVLASAEAQEQVLRNACRHLAPNGRLLLDMLTKHAALFGQALSAGEARPPLRLDTTLHDPRTGLSHQLWQSAWHEPKRKLWEIDREVRTLSANSDPVCAPRRSHLSGRYVEHDELLAMLDRCDLEAVSVHGGFENQPFTPESHRMVCTIQARSAMCP